MSFDFYYYYVLQASPLIPIAYYFFSCRQADPPLRFFLYYLYVSITLSVLMTIVAFMGMHNLWLMNIGSLLYAGLIMWGFSLWQESARTRKMMRLFIVVFAVIWSVEVIYFDRFFGFTTVARPIEGVAFVFSALLTIHQANKDTMLPIVDQPKFWISSGVILYFAGMIFLNLISNSLLKLSAETLKSALLIQPGLNLAAHLFYTWGFRCHCRRLKSSG